jgi:hypothetical protein
VTTPEGQHWLEREVLRAGRALDELRRALGRTGRPRIHVDVLAIDDADEPDGRTWREGMWGAARQAVSAAGESSVVFGLIAGRRRTMTAMATVTAQLLARPQDICVDVRVSTRKAEGGSGFYFPEQMRRWIDGPYGAFDAREVEVQLVDVPVPRLAGLIPVGGLKTWESALAAGQKTIDALRPPRVEVLLPDPKPRVTVDGVVLPLAGAKLLVFLSLVFQRQRTHEGWVVSGDETVIRTLVQPLSAYAWSDAVTAQAWKHLLGQGDGEVFDINDLSKARSDLRRAMKLWCQKTAPTLERWLVPEVSTKHSDGAKQTSQRLALPPEYLTVLT